MHSNLVTATVFILALDVCINTSEPWICLISLIKTFGSWANLLSSESTVLSFTVMVEEGELPTDDGHLVSCAAQGSAETLLGYRPSGNRKTPQGQGASEEAGTGGTRVNTACSKLW